MADQLGPPPRVPARRQPESGDPQDAPGWRRLSTESSPAQLADLGRLVAEVAHEIRNPLVAIESYFQLRDSLPKLELDEFALQAGEELQRIERLIDLLLAHARPRGADGEPGSPGAALAGVETLLQHRARTQRVRLDFASRNLPAVSLHDDGLRQVLLNLVLNAIEASPPESVIRVTHEVDDDALWLYIDDEGPGIAEGDRERVFEARGATSSGTGLGLAVSRRLVDEAGGRLEVERSPSDGARLSLWLPRATTSGAPD